MSTSKKLFTKLILAFLFLLTAPISLYGDIAMQVGAEGANFNGNWMLGYSFTAAEDILVTSLGFFDNNADGLVESHQVGIWDTAGNLITSTTVAPSDTLTGKFRFSSITPISLAAGQEYIIAGYDFRNDAAIRNDLGVDATVHPDITVTGGRWDLNTFTFPTRVINNSNIYYNVVSFEFQQVSVPEPGGMTLLSCLLVIGMAANRRRRKRG